MKNIDSVSCSDQFSDAASIQFFYNGGSGNPNSGGYFAVAANDVYCALAFGQQGHEQWTNETHVPVGNGILFPGTIGVRFRNYLAGRQCPDLELAVKIEDAYHIPARHWLT